MSADMNADTYAGDTTGTFNYMDQTVRPSLYRNGQVYTRRDRDGSDTEFFGAHRIAVDVPVRDARKLEGDGRKTCAANGFELVAAPLDDPDLDFFDHVSVARDYYRHCEAIVSAVSGGRARAFDHNIRSATGKKSRRRIAGGQQVQGPAHLVHGDYTLTSAPQRLRDLTRPPGGNDTLASVLPAGAVPIPSAEADRALDGGRFAIINLWRNIVEDPVETHPLALCDGRTVDPEDLVTFEIHYSDRIGENYFARHVPAHRWFYYPEMSRSEALLIKQWDSNGTLARTNGQCADHTEPDSPCTFSFHSAFKDPTTRPNAPDRWSIEVRCMVIYN